MNTHNTLSKQFHLLLIMFIFIFGQEYIFQIKKEKEKLYTFNIQIDLENKRHKKIDLLNYDFL